MHDSRMQETELMKNPHDPVNHPSHYNQGPIEVIDIIEASMTHEMFKGYLLGNVLKYMLRAPYKGNQEQDHKKAKWYFDKLRSVSNENK